MTVEPEPAREPFQPTNPDLFYFNTVGAVIGSTYPVSINAVAAKVATFTYKIISGDTLVAPTLTVA